MRWFYSRAVRRGFYNQGMPYSKPMKMITLWMTPEEKAMLEEVARNADVTLSHALREGLKLYFDDAKDWIEDRRGDEPGSKLA